MNLQTALTVLFVAAGIVSYNPVSAQAAEGSAKGKTQYSAVRHDYVKKNGIPSPYKGMKNSVAANSKSLEEGANLYKTNCELCHGAKGHGDGPGGKALDPRPANLASSVKMKTDTDAFLFWTVSEGGTQFGTGMPPFKDSLSADERWKVILYLRKKLGK